MLSQLEVDGPSGFDAVVGSFKAKTGIVTSMWSRISGKSKQLYTDLLDDVERTLTWPAQIQTLIYFLVPATHRTHAINCASVGTYAQAHSGSMDDFPDMVMCLGVQRSLGRNGSKAILGAGRRAGQQTRRSPCRSRHRRFGILLRYHLGKNNYRSAWCRFYCFSD